MNAIQFIKENGVDKARGVVSGAPIGCTHYRALSCGIRYTKHTSISECYIWNGIMWRACSAPDLIFTSAVIYPISELKKALKNQENNEIRLFRRHGIDSIKNMLETVPSGATHVTDDMRMFVNEHFDHLKTIKNQIPLLARISNLKHLVESVELIEKLGGIELLKRKIDGKHIGYTHFNINQNGRWSFVDHYVDFIPDGDGVYHIGMVNKAIADYEAIHHE